MIPDDPKTLVGATLYHLGNAVIGKVSAYYDGVESIYLSPMPDGSSQPLQGPAIEFESGHAFVWKADRFVRVSDKAATFYAHISNVVSKLTADMASVAKTDGLSPQEFAVTVSTVFKDQASAILRMRAGATKLVQDDPTLIFA